MQRFKKILAGVAALAALAFGGAQIAGATGGSSTNDKADGGDEAVTGATAEQAQAAAGKAAGGGQATEVRTENEGDAVYEVEVTKGGQTLEIKLDKSFG